MNWWPFKKRKKTPIEDLYTQEEIEIVRAIDVGSPFKFVQTEQEKRQKDKYDKDIARGNMRHLGMLRQWDEFRLDQPAKGGIILDTEEFWKDMDKYMKERGII